MPLSAACYPWHLWLCMAVLSIAPFMFFYGLIWTSYHLHHQCSFMASYGLLISCAFGCPDILLLSLVCLWGVFRQCQLWCSMPCSTLMILQTLRHALSSLRLSAMSQLARYVFWIHSWHWSSVCSWVGFDTAGAVSKWQPATSRFQGFLSEDTSYISVWQIYVEIERARLIRKLAKIKEEQGQIAEAAELMQEVAVCELPSYFYHPSWFWSMQVLWEASWKLCTFCWLVR